MAAPPIPTLEEVKKIVGDRVEEWTEDQLIAALAFIDVLAERDPPLPDDGHRGSCAWAKARKPKGMLCTCDPKTPR